MKPSCLHGKREETGGGKRKGREGTIPSRPLFPPLPPLFLRPQFEGTCIKKFWLREEGRGRGENDDDATSSLNGARLGWRTEGPKIHQLFKKSTPFLPAQYSNDFLKQCSQIQMTLKRVKSLRDKVEFSFLPLPLPLLYSEGLSRGLGVGASFSYPLLVF